MAARLRMSKRERRSRGPSCTRKPEKFSLTERSRSCRSRWTKRFARTASRISNQILADTITIRDLYKKHHWQAAGHTFYQLHLLFDKHHGEQDELVGHHRGANPVAWGYQLGNGRRRGRNDHHSPPAAGTRGSPGTDFATAGSPRDHPEGSAHDGWPGRRRRATMEQMTCWSATSFVPTSCRCGSWPNTWWMCRWSKADDTTKTEAKGRQSLGAFGTAHQLHSDHRWPSLREPGVRARSILCEAQHCLAADPLRVRPQTSCAEANSPPFSLHRGPGIGKRHLMNREFALDLRSGVLLE